MKTGRLMVAAVVALGSAIAVSAARAQVYVETTDAGQTLTTAFYTGAITGVPLTTILGEVSTDNDADLYVIDITSPTSFSASTVNAVTDASQLDTALFLLDGTGHAVATNDDASNISFDSALPAGNSLYANLQPGKYYLGVSESGNEPANSNNQLLFVGYPGGNTEAVRGPASGLNPTTEANFDSFAGDPGPGAYEIDLTGVATYAAGGVVSAAPEPAAWMLMIAGLSLAGATLRLGRRRDRAGLTTIQAGS